METNNRRRSRNHSYGTMITRWVGGFFAAIGFFLIGCGLISQYGLVRPGKFVPLSSLSIYTATPQPSGYGYQLTIRTKQGVQNYALDDGNIVYIKGQPQHELRLNGNDVILLTGLFSFRTVQRPDINPEMLDTIPARLNRARLTLWTGFVLLVTGLLLFGLSFLKPAEGQTTLVLQ